MVDYYVFTDKGERDNNEDYVGFEKSLSTNEYCFVLCDGLGGHGKGEVASQLVTEAVLDNYRKKTSDNWIASAILDSQDKLIEKQKELHEVNGMKTTLVILYINDIIAKYAHVGDSRGYYFYKNKFKERTMDHSVPQMLVAAREIKEKDIRHHPDRNRLLKVMGIEWDDDNFEIGDEIILKYHRKHAFLLCSDGFWELITEKEMEKCLSKASSAKEWVESMQKIVLQNGVGTHMDNYSAIAVIIEE